MGTERVQGSVRMVGGVTLVGHAELYIVLWVASIVIGCVVGVLASHVA